MCKSDFSMCVCVCVCACMHKLCVRIKFVCESFVFFVVVVQSTWHAFSLAYPPVRSLSVSHIQIEKWNSINVIILIFYSRSRFSFFLCLPFSLTFDSDELCASCMILLFLVGNAAASVIDFLEIAAARKWKS